MPRRSHDHRARIAWPEPRDQNDRRQYQRQAQQVGAERKAAGCCWIAPTAAGATRAEAAQQRLSTNLEQIEPSRDTPKRIRPPGGRLDLPPQQLLLNQSYISRCASQNGLSPLWSQSGRSHLVFTRESGRESLGGHRTKDSTGGVRRIIRYRSELPDWVHRSSYGALVVISWAIVSQSGLPTKRESQLHYAFEDGLQAAEEGERVGVLAVVATGEGKVEWYYLARSHDLFIRSTRPLAWLVLAHRMSMFNSNRARPNCV